MEDRILSDIKRKLSIDNPNIDIKIDEDNIAYLNGEVNSWDEVVEIGLLVGKKRKIKNVVNNLYPKGAEVNKKNRESLILKGKEKGIIEETDIVIIGGGVIGCGIAREFSKYRMRVSVIEKEEDIAKGTTKANNGMIHPGNAAVPYTLKAELNVKGNEMYTKWAEELNFPFKRKGSIILAYNREQRRLLNLAYIAGKLNKVPGMRKISGKEAMKIEKSIEKEPEIALWTPTTAYVDGYGVCIALAENAAENGVKFHLETEVVDVLVEKNEIKGVITNKGIIKSKYIINAAGLYADEIAEMAGDRFYTIHPRKGGIIIFDKNKDGVYRSVAVPGTKSRNKQSKGGGPQITVEGNALWGPSAKEVRDKEDLSFTKEELEYCLDTGSRVDLDFEPKDIIAYFSGLRAADYKEDFIIEKSNKIKGFVHVAGIQSPGLAAAPAIAERVVNIIRDEEGKLDKNKKFNPVRKAPVEFRYLSREEQDRLIKEDPRYGNIICRCETITEAEIVNAIHGNIPCTTIDGVKRRTRASMGRCQGGFCSPKILSILARELNVDVEEVTQKGHDSNIIVKKAREVDLGGESSENY